ncbi:MAG TPA: hypothetical protein VMV49_01940 [Candidatus Deferrimicrobium sp.]|nr:hypothetical protein [Candidatus Deferrimicrobium sp.]
MGRFDLSKFDGVLGIGLLGGAISCFIIVIVCDIVKNLPGNLPEVIYAVSQIGFYTMLTGAIIFIFGILLIGINTFRARHSETGGTPTSHVLIIVCLSMVILVVSLILHGLIF